MIRAVSAYGSVFDIEHVPTIRPDSALWDFTITELSKFKLLESFTSRFRDLGINKCVYNDFITLNAEDDSVKEIYLCPCGVHRAIILSFKKSSLVYASKVVSCVKRLLRGMITCGGFRRASDTSSVCAYCHEKVDTSFEVNNVVMELRKHISSELDKDEGVRLCYCNKPNVCKCYVKQSIGFKMCIPMLYSTEGKHSTWCNICEFPRFCTTAENVSEKSEISISASRNLGTDNIPFNYVADVMPLAFMTVTSRLLNDIMSLTQGKKTIYLQRGCNHSDGAHCECDGDDVLTNCVFINTCVTYSMAMWFRSALKERGITFVVECISCGKTQLCPERIINAYEEFNETCADVAECSVELQESDRVILNYMYS